MQDSKSIKGALASADATTISFAPADDALHELTVIEAAARVSCGNVTSRQLVETCLRRINTHSHLNAFISVDAQRALARADAYDQRIAAGETCLPLGGVPLAIKDNIAVKGFNTTAGTPALKHHHAARNAAIIDRLEAAGAIVIGKANMHELAYGTSGYNTAYHVPGIVGVRNAYHPDYIAGGSSSGSASAVAARLVPAALGTDTGGSMRLPCALNGCVGFRPSMGRYSTDGVVPVSPTRDTPGPMARCVEDVIVLDQIITGLPPAPVPALQDIRLGRVEEFWTELAPDVAFRATEALTQLERAGVTIVSVSLPEILALNAKVSMPIVLYETFDALQDYLQRSGAGVTLPDLIAEISSTDVKGIFEQFILPRKAPGGNGDLEDLAPAYRWAIETGRAQMIADYQALMKTHHLDALVFPTTPDLALPSSLEATSFAAFARMIRNTDPGANAGLPGISLPIGLAGTPSLPVGLEIDGLPNSDDRLLAIAQALQNVFGREIPPAD
nr:indoleacetamide hydrolase [uncultured Pseudomonas sp.]